MARWRLTEKHYLKSEGIIWDYKEQDQATGRTVRKVYEVPIYLNPEDAADQNYRETGEIIVCHKDKGKPRDIVFFGPPTSGMEPLDEEAEAISEAERHKWVNPIDSLPTTGSLGDAMLESMHRQLAEIQAGQAKAATPAPPSKELDELKEQVKQVMEQNAKLMAQLGRRA